MLQKNCRWHSYLTCSSTPTLSHNNDQLPACHTSTSYITPHIYHVSAVATWCHSSLQSQTRTLHTGPKLTNPRRLVADRRMTRPHRIRNQLQHFIVPRRRVNSDWKLGSNYMKTVTSPAKHRGAQGNQRSISSSSESVSQSIGGSVDGCRDVVGSIGGRINRRRSSS